MAFFDFDSPNLSFKGFYLLSCLVHKVCFFFSFVCLFGRTGNLERTIVVQEHFLYLDVFLFSFCLRSDIWLKIDSLGVFFKYENVFFVTPDFILHALFCTIIRIRFTELFSFFSLP